MRVGASARRYAADNGVVKRDECETCPRLSRLEAVGRSASGSCPTPHPTRLSGSRPLPLGLRGRQARADRSARRSRPAPWCGSRAAAVRRSVRARVPTCRDGRGAGSRWPIGSNLHRRGRFDATRQCIHPIHQRDGTIGRDFLCAQIVVAVDIRRDVEPDPFPKLAAVSRFVGDHGFGLEIR